MKIEQIKLEGAQIVEFEPKFAASVADMWDITEQKVLDEELNSDSLVLYLLIDDNKKVIGADLLLHEEDIYKFRNWEI